MSKKFNELTVKDLKKIMKLLGSNGYREKNIYRKYLGKYVLVRSRNEGVNAGFVVDLDETGIILKDARRLWGHSPKDQAQSWYEGVANTGLSTKSTISPPTREKVIIEDYSITVCTDTAKDSIRGFKSHAQKN